jgi:diguanylate cyclase (GGDEF)-like protein
MLVCGTIVVLAVLNQALCDWRCQRKSLLVSMTERPLPPIQHDALTTEEAPRARGKMRIRTRLLLLVLVTLLPALIGAALGTWYIFRTQQDELRQNLSETTHAVALLLDKEIARRESMLRVLAESPALDTGDFAEFSQQVLRVVPTPEYAIIMALPDGRQFMNTRLPLGAANVPQLPELIELQRRTLGNTTQVSDLFLAPLTQSYNFAVEVPVIRDGRIRYYMSLVSPVAQWQPILHMQGLPPEWVGAIIDRNGVVMARTHEPQKYIGHKVPEDDIRNLHTTFEGSHEGISLNGMPATYFFSRLPRTGWTFLIHVPDAAMQRVAMRTVFLIGGIALLLLGSAVVTAYLVARSTVKPIEALRMSALLIGRGKVIKPQDSGIAEIDAVGAAMIEAGEEIRKARSELEQRVHEASAAARQMTFLANHDVLTGVPNRALLNDRLQNALIVAARDQRKLALLFVDIDHFKDVNDSLGHDVGDLLLIEITKCFTAVVRASDTVCRQGGDEFIILIPDIDDNYGAGEVANKLQAQLANIRRIGRHEVRVAGSIGIAIYPDDGVDADTLVKHADLAMYHVKAAGRNGFDFYSRAMTEAVAKRLRLESGLRHAIECNEFIVHYQPKVELTSGRIIGAEALVRWQHPTLGLIPPNQFISVAEGSGLIKPIGSWVLKEACRQNRAWQMAGFGLIPIGVNLSAVQLHQEGFLQEVIDTLKELDLPRDSLEFEVTESVSIHGQENAIEWLRTLKSMGVRLSIDDFGTGYSSLSYLKRLPIDTIKIDQSFVRGITTDPDDAAIIEAIIRMAHSLRLDVIAEGVETVAQLDFLRARDCDQVQGFYYSEPLSAEGFSELLSGQEELA